MPPDLDPLRRDIDDIDTRIIELLARRRSLSLDMARAKEGGPAAFKDDTRERSLLESRLEAAAAHGLDATLVTRLWREILDDSLRVQHGWVQDAGEQRPMVAAFQGIEGAYSHLASQEFFEGRQGPVTHLGCRTFAEAVAAVEEDRADVAVLPTENTTSGAISEVYDLLMHSRLSVVGEIRFRVRHCLLGLEGADPDRIERIYCHPQAVLQCSEFLAGLDGVDIHYFGDTAMSGLRIKDLGDPTAAAIASEEAARHLGLDVLRRDIANRDENYTRFLVAARTPIEVDRRIPTKTSLVMAVGNRPGALLDALACFRDEAINLVKLESRPVARNPSEEMFYLDLDGNVADPAVQRALAALSQQAAYVKVLGSYPSRDLRR
jgi:chorismate mutase/prephenate dehydratase